MPLKPNPARPSDVSAVPERSTGRNTTRCHGYGSKDEFGRIGHRRNPDDEQSQIDMARESFAATRDRLGARSIA